MFRQPLRHRLTQLHSEGDRKMPEIEEMASGPVWSPHDHRAELSSFIVASDTEVFVYKPAPFYVPSVPSKWIRI